MLVHQGDNPFGFSFRQGGYDLLVLIEKTDFGRPIGRLDEARPHDQLLDKRGHHRIVCHPGEHDVKIAGQAVGVLALGVIGFRLVLDKGAKRR